MKTSRRVGLALFVAVALSAASQLTGQDARTRVSQQSDGQLRFTVKLRPEVCGSGQNIWRTGDGRSHTNWGIGGYSRDVEFEVECDAGPGRVVIDKRGGTVRDVRFYVGGRWRVTTGVTDLGALGTRAAADLLLDIARTNDGKAGRNAIFPLTVLDSVVIWRDLLQLARDESRPRDTRKQAVFWLGQLAEAPATSSQSSRFTFTPHPTA